MIKPYLIATHNPETEYLVLAAKAKLNNPLAFLEDIQIDGEWASNAPAFDIKTQLEFVLIDESLITKVKSALVDFGFEVTITDATEKLLHGNIDLTNASNKTKQDIKRFYLANYDANDILDKISNSKNGVECLTELDKRILNRSTL